MMFQINSNNTNCQQGFIHQATCAIIGTIRARNICDCTKHHQRMQAHYSSSDAACLGLLLAAGANIDALTRTRGVSSYSRSIKHATIEQKQCETPLRLGISNLLVAASASGNKNMAAIDQKFSSSQATTLSDARRHMQKSHLAESNRASVTPKHPLSPVSPRGQ